MNRNSKRSKWSITLVLCVVGVVIASGVMILGKPDPEAIAQEQAAIQTIKSHYEASDQLLSLSPDLQDAIWVAIKWPLCDDPKANCWLVHGSIETLANGEKRKVDAKWIVDLNSHKDLPNNAEARIMFHPVLTFESPTLGMQTDQHSPNEGQDALATSTEDARIEFQKDFPTLDKSMPNLRWADDQIEGGRDAQEAASLVTPYGPCIEFDGNTSAGYVLLFVGNYYHDPHGKPTILGGLYKDRLEAIHTAENYCHKWYISERSKPPNLARDSHIWFTPEEEPAPVSDQTSSGSPSLDLSAVHALQRVETFGPLPAGNKGTDEDKFTYHQTTLDPSQSRGTDLHKLGKNFTWSTLPDGSERLSGSNGNCATLSAQRPQKDSGLTLLLSDGTTKIFPVQQLAEADQAAEDYCLKQEIHNPK